LHQNDIRQSQLRLHLVVFIWGFTAILGDLISKEALPLVWNRILITLVVLLIYFRWRKISFSTDRKTLRTLLLAGIVIAAHWVTFFHAIKISNVSVTLVCLSSGAFFASILEPIFFRRRLMISEFLLGLAVIGAIAMIFTIETGYFWGIVTALTSAFLSAVFSVINGKLTHNHRSETITFWELTGGWLALSALLLFNGDLSLGTLPQSRNDWFFLLILGSVCTAYPFIESVRIMKKLSPFTVMLTINLEPVYGIALAYVLLGAKEHMQPGFYIGAVLIILVLFINAWLRKRRTAMLQHVPKE
jgi:drug/metabolite transporter (DMT)-like permease